MQPDIIVTAPLPPFLYEPLKADYRCHDYVQASDKAAFLAACGGLIRGLVQGGGTVFFESCRHDASGKLKSDAAFMDMLGSFGMKLADVPLKALLAEPIIPYETDEGTRLICDSHDAAASRAGMETLACSG